ncbi:MAG: threonine synthase [Caldimicrobium sp.]|nr:threonine synthase [Caldimicrobium sp.]MCX7612691.1 threonine synthase [Caldimicrobium sp.]MDW8182449.1 threonine synthase [Caldimicrobium sp.]
MRYQSTRGVDHSYTFTETVFEGLAPDGGLIVPETIPRLSGETIEAWSKLDYLSLALEIFKLFATDIPTEALRDIIKKSYSSFRHEEITPVVKVGDLYILELFHGPTFAFKDIALQFLGNLFEYLLSKTGKKINILGATSGDTGASAIYAVRGKQGIAIFILYPHQRVSPIQALMMTTVIEPNVHNIAIEGSFDDCQKIVKDLFMDLPLKRSYGLTAINSINFARILAQIVYYFYAYFKVSKIESKREVRFAVPTGNFGDIFAGYLAKRMLGRGIERLILATNENDILARFVNYGDYSVGQVIPTISPAMDIQVASNFERYLYYLFGEDTEKTALAMREFQEKKRLSFTKEDLISVKKDFLARSVTQEETLETIRDFYHKNGYMLDPHTAVGVKAGLTFKEEGIPLICLSTAHPAKFPETVSKAIGKDFPLPPEIEALKNKPQGFHILKANIEEVKTYLQKNALT